MRRTCLIVDDEPAIRTFLRTVFEQYELDVLEADSARDALRILHNDRVPDLVLSDVNLNAEMSGLDLAHSVRHTFPSLPVILISGYCDQDTNEMDGFPFISKPFVIDAIMKAVGEAIRPRALGAAC